MVESIHIKNFKSIADEKIELGRVNVLIGSNGSGKSNILEAIAFLSASLVSRNIDKNILFGKGVRLAKPSLMITSERGKKQEENILIDAMLEDEKNHSINAYNNSSNGNFEWKIEDRFAIEDFKEGFLDKETAEMFFKMFWDKTSELYLSEFLIYTLNTLTLRGLATVSHQSPVGIYGENLDVLIANFNNKERNQLKEYFYLIDWLENYILDTEDALKLRGFKQNLSTSRLYFEDKYMMRKDNNHIFSSENANEGILHLFFYLAIMISEKTPSFFAIDNIESCLNPHLCRRLIKEICKLAEANDKQVIITTHNPAILDGLNLHDDNIRLFEVKRDDGLTTTRRIKVKPKANGKQYKLSELWTEGYLGAIPENF
ncbi:MAG: AAA family ATPase [Saprospiraceae bacterium]